MRIAEFTSYIVRLRLRKPFKHASYTRQTSDNLLVRCRLADGTEGWGEGVPRPYVTGECPEGAMAQLAASSLLSQLDGSCHSWSDVVQLLSRYRPWIQEEDPRGCRANAHRCAVELSVLDAFGRLFGEPVRAVTKYMPEAAPIRHDSRRVQYSGAVSSGRPRREVLSALAMRAYGFRHCKVKVGMAGGDDGARLRRIRRWVGSRMDLRIDANEAWSAEQVVGQLEPLLGQRISCVEQPVPHADLWALAEVRRHIPVPIMLDESLTSLVDAEAAIAHHACDLFNIRLSKCGGLLNSVRLAARAWQAGLGFQIGCHPGESGILSAAGRHLLTSVGPARYREGSADRHLLKDRLTHQDLTFGYGGWAPALTGPGLGVTVDPEALSRLVVDSQPHTR
jgi:muconate cycloisomerase